MCLQIPADQSWTTLVKMEKQTDRGYLKKQLAVGIQSEGFYILRLSCELKMSLPGVLGSDKPETDENKAEEAKSIRLFMQKLTVVYSTRKSFKILRWGTNV